MRKYARSENTKIVRKVSDSEPEKIGSRVFPFRSPPASMPSVGTRRTTRVFVPKSVSKVADGDLATMVLRSGKRFVPSKPVDKKTGSDGYECGVGDEWPGLFESSSDASDCRWWKGDQDSWREPVAPEPVGPAGSHVEEEAPEELVVKGEARPGWRFDIVYSRKRRKLLQSDGSGSSSSFQLGQKELKERRWGLYYDRKYYRKKPRVSFSVKGVVKRTEFEITEAAREFTEKAGISRGDFLFGSASLAAVVVIVESSHIFNYRFPFLLISVLRGMRRRRRVILFELAAFLLSNSISGAFSMHGIHFLPVGHLKSGGCFGNAVSGAGICKLFGSHMFVPLVSLNFAALPFYFKSLHSALSLHSQFPSIVLARYLTRCWSSVFTDISIVEHDLPIPYEADNCGIDIVSNGGPYVKTNEVARIDEMSHIRDMLHEDEAVPVGEASPSASRSVAVIYSAKFRKHQRRRRSSRSGRARNHSLMNSRRNILQHGPILNANSAAEAHPLFEDMPEPIPEKHFEACLSDLSFGEESAASPSSVYYQKQRKFSRKNPSERLKETKLDLAEVKQNIDTVRCNVNILAIESDRCWREEGAEVMLESSGSNEWCLAVKMQGSTRQLHYVQKAQEMKTYVSNRYTQAIMWTLENGWKLEFCDKRDWIVFKELHRECRERNIKIIPIPGIREVSGYDESVISSFVRPELYIITLDDEIERALTSENAYDMDSGDEKWLQRFNSRSLVTEHDGSGSRISEGNFEKILYTFEKSAYGHPDDVYEHDKAISLCSDLGKKDIVAAVYEFWLKKRKQKRSALVKVFQGPPKRKAQPTQKPCLRKKRSFKRQGSHGGKGKPENFIQVAAKQETMRRVQQAESEANRAVELAIKLRSQAQMLMANADLATYKSVMALSLAEAMRESNSSDIDSIVGLSSDGG